MKSLERFHGNLVERPRCFTGRPTSSVCNRRNRISLLYYYSLGVSIVMLLFTTLQCIVCNAVLAIVKPYLRLPVSLSVKRVTTRTKLTPYERSMHLVFRHEEWLVGDLPFYLKFWVKLTHPPSKTPTSNRYSLVAPQP